MMLCGLSWYCKGPPGGPGGGTHSPRVPGSPATMGDSYSYLGQSPPPSVPFRGFGFYAFLTASSTAAG